MARRAAVVARGGRAALRCAVALAALAALATPAAAFYLPGVAPQDYAKVRRPARAMPRLCVPPARSGWPLLELTQTLASRRLAPLPPPRVQGDKVGIKVNKLSSTKTQLPYDYYSLPFCKPPTIVNSAENLGEASPARAAQRHGAAPHAPDTRRCSAATASKTASTRCVAESR